MTEYSVMDVIDNFNGLKFLLTDIQNARSKLSEKFLIDFENNEKNLEFFNLMDSQLFSILTVSLNRFEAFEKILLNILNPENTENEKPENNPIQQKLIEERQLIEQEKRNISIIDDELFNLEEKWTTEKRNKLTQEWKEFLKQNNLLPNDFTRVQYWFRNHKSKDIEFK
jgi:DNA gyrase/topoisomerase IV subunit A